MSPSILVVEDEAKIARILMLELKHEHYDVEIADTGNSGLEKALQEKWDLILLDVMLPGLSGLEVLRRFRKVNRTIPVILLTARDSTPDIVSGLDMGANDYMTKPFEIEELLARVRSAIRSKNAEMPGPASESADAEILETDGLSVNLKSREVSRDGKGIDLTPKEYDLLVFLLQNKNEVVSREQILNQVWGYDFIGDTNVIEVYIRYLRKKIDSGFKSALIQTIRGIGYCLRENQ